MKLRGGVASSIPGDQVLTVVTVLMLTHTVLTALIWTDTIKFASNDAKLAVGITVSVLAAFLLIYLLAIGFSSSN